MTKIDEDALFKAAKAFERMSSVRLFLPALRAAIEAYEAARTSPVGGWEPIESAKRDGSLMLGAWQLIRDNGWVRQVIYWDDGEYAWLTSWGRTVVVPSVFQALPALPGGEG
jgi:hypothetical protein